MAVDPSRKYEGKSPLKSILADLERIGADLSAIEAHKKKQAKTGLYIFAAGLVLTAVDAVVLPLLLPLSILAIIGGLGFWLYSLFTGGSLVQQRKRLQIAQERLMMIQPDAKPEKPFDLRLGLWATPVQLSNETWHGRNNGKQEFLEESWFLLEGPLLDGTVLSDEIKDLARKRTYSNARGKRKSKTRLTHLVTVRFSYPTERYGDARLAQQALKEEVKMGPAATLRSVRVTEKAIVLKAMVSSDQEIVRTAGMLSMGGYRILNLARRAASAQRGKAS